MPALTLEQAHNLAIQYQRQGRLHESESICRQILQRHPNHPEVLNTLAILAQQNARPNEALDFYASAIASNPNLPELHYNLGNLHKDLGDFQSAIDSYQRALELRPDFRPALNNLANALKETGRLDESRQTYRRALAIQPDPRIASSLAYLMYFDPHAAPADIAAEHARWNQTYAKPLLPKPPAHANDRDPDRRLKIGYVSPDFRNHPVARFLLPLVLHHDRAGFELFFYSDTRRPDSMTAQLQSHADHWRDAARLSDEQLAELISQDKIDILIDLTMHMEGNRLLTFARKPAPVQVTYLAYAGTTGLTAIDYRLSDPHLDPPPASPVEPPVASPVEPPVASVVEPPVASTVEPPGSDETAYAEQTIRLRSYWCYLPPSETPDVGPLPALATNHVTFGCLNNFSKINHRVLETWRSLLRQLPGSRLVLAAHQGAHRDGVTQYFSKVGVAADRIEFTGILPFAQYLAQYNRIDIALDPFPYPGGTTSLDAIFMGVPIVTLPAQTAVSRAGVSILHNLHLPELIATSPAHYLEIAANLAGDIPRLTTIRTQLRAKLLNSPLADHKLLTDGFETTLRHIWKAWCART